MALAVCLGVAAACSDNTGPKQQAGNSTLDTLAGLVVEPAATSGVAYVSLAPSSVPTGVTATIRDRESGLSVSVGLIGGGFDPVAIAARVGDTLAVEIARDGSTEPLQVVAPVQAGQAPVVVRTSPVAGDSGVPLNRTVVVVFSDPIDPTTVNASSIQLWQGTKPVPGAVRLADTSGLRAEFRPDSLLAAQTAFRLVITRGVRDVNAVGLDSALEVRFKTGGVTQVAAKLAFSVEPVNTIVGSVITPPVVVTIEDSLGKAVSGASDAVTVALGGMGRTTADTLRGTTTVRAVDGVATYSDLSLSRANTAGLTLLAWSGKLAVAISTPFLVTAPPRRPQLAFTVQPGDAVAGVAISPAVVVTIEDSLGNRVAGASNTVTVADPYGPPLLGTTTAQAVNGVATFADLSLNTASASGSGYRLTATSDSLISATSASFAIKPAAPAKLVLDAWGGKFEAGQTFQVQVEIQDAFGNRVTSASNAVTVALAANPTGASLTGTLTVPAVGGVATFADLKISQAGSGYTLAVTSAGLTSLALGPFAIWSAGAFAAVSAGGAHTCALTEAGYLYCWGSNSNGQVGDGTTTDRTSPVLVAEAMTEVSTGNSHSCGMNSSLYCWGANGDGQIGDGTTADRTSPILVGGVFGGPTGVSAGGAHTCANFHDDYDGAYLMCWGRNANGQLGDSTTTQSASPVVVDGGWTLGGVTSGGSHTCAYSGAAVYCWGRNDNGQLGDGTNTQRTSPVEVTGGLVLYGISAGGSHTCGLTQSGAAYCWGLNDNGQLGDGTTIGRQSPVAVAGGLSFVGLSAGRSHTCGVTAANAIYCWGLNGNGQLGDGTTSMSTTPTLVAGGLAFWSVSAGGAHTCGVTLTGTYCWGANANGQLGNGTTTDSSVPVKVAGQPQGAIVTRPVRAAWRPSR